MVVRGWCGQPGDWAAAEFEDLRRGIHRQLVPGQAPGARDLFVPVAYCRLPVRATPKALCKTIVDVYGGPHPSTLDDLVRSVRDTVRDHSTTAPSPSPQPSGPGRPAPTRRSSIWSVPPCAEHDYAPEHQSPRCDDGWNPPGG